jgi:hypothetical protein
MTNNPPVPRKATWRLGARQRERLQWAVVAFICLVMLIPGRQIYLYIVETRDFQTCQSNMLQIAGALGRYKSDWDDTLPQGPTWMETLSPFLSPRSGTGFKAADIFHCPRDKSGAGTSYAWNTLFDGFSETHRSTSSIAESNRGKLGVRPDRVPMILEVHGGELNKTVRPLDWDAVGIALSKPHTVSGRLTGSIITGGLRPSSLTGERLSVRRGDKF